MKPIYEAAAIQIEITNACDHVCSNCTRFVGHHKKPYFMDLKAIRDAIDSLEGFEGGIGLMGGEPTLHPQFREICKIYQEMIPDKKKRYLWTDGYNWEKYGDVIRETFEIEHIVYNNHSEDTKGYHQQLLIAADEIIEDKELMWELINNCWIQKRWSPSINTKGCFFCEVAAAQDLLFEGPGGYPIEKDWWKKEPKDFQDQVKRYCVNCSAAIPLEIGSSSSPCDLVSKGNAERLKQIKSPKFLCNKMRIYDKKYTKEDYEENVKDWKPGYFRDFVQHEPGIKIPINKYKEYKDSLNRKSRDEKDDEYFKKKYEKNQEELDKNG